MTILSSAQESRLRTLLAQAHRQQLADPEWVVEFQAWTARPELADDGVPVRAAGLAPGSHDLWTLRDFGEGAGRQAGIGNDFEQQPLVAVLATHTDSAYDQVQAGTATERMLLAATTQGLAASFMSQVIEVDDARLELKRLLGGSLHPQAVFRIGYGSPVPSSGRRDVSDLVIDRAPSLEKA